ncbi:hypothetical protein DRW03_10435 [Corallococcus sp. H22C18031201]|uniref:hypothetical protein n=1 Tax=Citreicoccus inhibens TaxID=2849499 RepID=UPI000E71A5ED|nr:hypothetical protein [Citreicoccus inhibens]MBU8898829.1 hypothetical protein [Citreicoccus inhibens]RJS24019.1 hypothetical protein DRW03_10435 [Corallococcus sp. H22C18031201]
MRRAVLLVALCLAVSPLACKTTQPPGTQNQEPLEGPDTVREPDQNVPDIPPGPAAPFPSDGGSGPPKPQ